VLPANPTATDYETAINAIETAVLNSTSPLSFQNWAYAMVEEINMEVEFADKKSIKLACGDEYCVTAKPKSKISMNVKNTKDPHILQLLTGEKAVLDTATNTYYSSTKSVCTQIPQVVAKIVSCPDENGDVDTYYLLPTTLAGTIATMFKDYCENDFEGSELELELASGGCMFKKVTTFDATKNDDPTTV
jgi:hypothetical protein